MLICDAARPFDREMEYIETSISEQSIGGVAGAGRSLRLFLEATHSFR